MPGMRWPDHLLTLAEFDELPEDDPRHHELQEGVLQVSPKAALLHQRAVHALTRALTAQLSAEWEAIGPAQVALDATWPPTVRTPDAVIVPTSVVDLNPNRVHANVVAVALEVVSPGSRSTDRIVKPYEYARAGIPHYWVVDIDEPVSLTAYRLVDGGYETCFDGAGTFKTTAPFDLALDLQNLVRRLPGR
ncbi:Uma2 family endonuclease [Saccharopolyspora gregorii]|uniref:Uma2 family endonuclease n=2 Tax=Saccharopolyspora gregorii TaxID=33914 RepID=A0ABP6RZ40_9PSEU